MSIVLKSVFLYPRENYLLLCDLSFLGSLSLAVEITRSGWKFNFCVSGRVESSFNCFGLIYSHLIFVEIWIFLKFSFSVLY